MVRHAFEVAHEYDFPVVILQSRDRTLDAAS
jgi:hypothetical protein